MNDDSQPLLPEAPYAFRPAKRVQRVMFCDALRGLRVLRRATDYQYVGLGHWQFVDFELMRREVGIRSMVSIERDTSRLERYKANRPFGEIELRFGHAYEQLQEIDLSRPTVAWLDYVDKLTAHVIRDLNLLVERTPPGSVVAVTFNSKPDREDSRLDSLRRLVGEDKVPGDVGEESLDRDGLPRVQRRILVEQLSAVAAARAPSASIEQFMFLRYSDRAPMTFWAGMIVDDSVRGAFSAAGFDRMDQYAAGDEPLDVAVPWLTTREVIVLNEQLRAGKTPQAPGIPTAECESYARLHRWYPAVPLPM